MAEEFIANLTPQNCAAHWLKLSANEDGSFSIPNTRTGSTKQYKARSMFANAFIGKPEEPADDELAAALGRTRRLWDQLVSELAAEHGITIQEWNCYSKKAGWALRLKRKDRVIVYLSPGRGCFMASFALGDKAVQAALASGLPEPVLQIVKEARRYAEGTAVRLEVRTAADVEAVRKLAGVKLAN